MLEKLDLSKKTKKSDYKRLMDDLELKLGVLQRQATELKIPIIIVFEGWGASGKGRRINELLMALDPRGVNVYPTHPPQEEEYYRPFLWRFWTKTPARGRIAIFDRSWYGRFLVERMDRTISKMAWTRAYDEVKAFERQLIDDGCVVVKFFLHISQKEQRKRLKGLQSNPFTSWRVTEYDWKKHTQYDTYLEVTEEMLASTDTDFAPWTLIEAQNWRFATVKVFKTIARAIEDRVDEMKRLVDRKKPALRLKDEPASVSKRASASVLDRADLSRSLSREAYRTALRKYQRRIHDLEHEVYRKRMPVVIVYEGWDAAGKGGNIKRLVQRMDPRGYEVIPIAAPNDIEKDHHYLWRFWTKIPKAGHFAIFDRSWYGRVLVERVEGFCTEEEWKRGYREINEMEEHLANFGTAIFKFWIDIDPEEQLRRFEDRARTSYKQWKITEEDWRNRERWDAYRLAVDEMLARTSTSCAPWTIVESNSKLYARIKTLKMVVKELEKRLIKT